MDEYVAMDVLMESKSLAQLKHELDCLPNTLLLPIARECLDRFALANYAGFIGNVLSISVPFIDLFGELIHCD
ncbi:hypothetical protein LOAG_17019 [Loa loa]|uniref:Uncharacterized protein n=1 Tax=Loa loa TaxID=7209 RepID=A0A1S0UM78_LOALO|nr:hypothetical protein LOAG_17019 [Loa loa]EJD75937.1 hypothetical protein LOAG_17019 [Loa loa]